MEAVLITEEEYLKTDWNPDREYVDGEVRERNVGEWHHGRLQFAITFWFGQHEKDWNIYVVPECRMKATPTRYRIPDILIQSRDVPVEQIVISPPLLAIEILSPEDRISAYRERFEDFRAMGIRFIWVLDPIKKEAFYVSHYTMVPAPELRLPDSEIHIPLPGIFSMME